MTTHTAHIASLAPNEGEIIPGLAGSVSRLLLESRELDLAIMKLTAGGEPPRHVHTREDEWAYILEGELDVSVGDEAPFRASAGSLVWLPVGIPHSYVVRGSHVRAVFGAQPGGLVQMFRDFVEAFGGEVPEVLTEDHQRAFVETSARYGITILALGEEASG
jgi:quercetin dioxygenase-like cupin family protein